MFANVKIQKIYPGTVLFIVFKIVVLTGDFVHNFLRCQSLLKLLYVVVTVAKLQTIFFISAEIGTVLWGGGSQRL